MASDDHFERTMQTYNQVADQYVARGKRNGRWDTPSEHFQQFLNHLPSMAKVLDVGCGPGIETAYFRQAGLLTVGLDFSIGMLKQAQQQVGTGFGQADMRQLPVAAASLDAVWMQASLLHLPRVDAPQAIAEAYRVLRPSGHYYMSVKQGDGEEYIANLADQPRYFIYYQPDEVRQLVTSGGFTIIDQWLVETPYVNWIAVIATKSAN